jgi:hypothetical protein
MPYAAITYPLKPGHEDDVAELFSRFQRVSSPAIRDGAGAEVGRLLGTAVFVKDTVLVRVIHYEGSFEDIARTMAAQPGVHALEAALAPYLAEQRDTSSPEKFGAYFRASTMRCVSQLSVDTLPAH